MAWDTSVSDLRTKLSDNSQDKLRALKPVFGKIDGNNRLFKTFEYRRTTDFTQNSGPLGIYIDQQLVNSSLVASDDVSSGYFTLVNAPDDGSEITASYYCQWFTDDEIQSFLRLATNWLDLGDNYSNLETVLRPAALAYSSAEAYQKLALRWVENNSEIYRLEDAPNANKKTIAEQYMKMAEGFRADALKLRNDFYDGRSGQAKQPLFAFGRGRAREVAPRR